jgi:hypothetical protein
MAQFGIEATQLSAPQGAGASPVAPVTAGIMDNGAGGALGGILNIFAKGLENKQKEEAAALKQGVVGSFVKGQQKINEAVRSGQMTPSEAKMRSRAHFGEFAAGYSEFIGDIEGAAKALRGNTELGDVEDEVKAGLDLHNSAKAAAQSSGYSFVPGMTKAQEQSQIDAHQASTRAEAEMARLYRKNAEERAQGTFDQGIADREAKETSVRLINTIADTNFTASYDYAQSLSQAVRAGTISQEDASLEWNRKMGSINAQIQAAAGTNPELAGPYRTLFADLQGLGDKLLDPKTQLDVLESEVKMITNRAKLTLLQKPRIATIVAASALMGQNATLALQSTAPVIEAVTSIFSESVDSPLPKSQIVGNPEIEKEVFNFTTASLKSFNRGDFKNNPKAAVEMKNTVDNILQQITDVTTRRGANPKSLTEAAKFLASPEFGEYASKNRIDTEAQIGAIKAMEILYNKEVAGAINREIQTAVTTQDRFGAESAIDAANRTRAAGSAQGAAAPVKSTTTQFDPKKLKIVFKGAGVHFELENPSSDVAVARMERSVINSLKKAQVAINQQVHMGAHLEGSVDYAKYWEATKHILAAGFFSPPERKEGEQPVGGSYKLEKDLPATAANTPSENASAARREPPEVKANRVAQDIIAIKSEIKKATDPETKRILENELRKLGAQ